jgi:hypothetical protein
MDLEKFPIIIIFNPKILNHGQNHPVIPYAMSRWQHWVEPAMEVKAVTVSQWPVMTMEKTLDGQTTFFMCENLKSFAISQ